MAKVKIQITAVVTTVVDLDETKETLKELLNRNVDIYLHGAGENGHWEKSDLGVDESVIIIIG